MSMCKCSVCLMCVYTWVEGDFFLMASMLNTYFSGLSQNTFVSRFSQLVAHGTRYGCRGMTQKPSTVTLTVHACQANDNMLAREDIG